MKYWCSLDVTTFCGPRNIFVTRYSGGTVRYIYATTAAELKIYTNNRGPPADSENVFGEFECLKLRSGDDPALLNWELENLLAKADPSLAPDTKKALLARQYRQYMKGLLRTLQFKLLEHNPTPTLDEML